jgi:CYTH domain-containing protein
MTLHADAPLYRFVFTGGPCAGKTAAQAHVAAHLRALGWQVFCVPEVATLFIDGGIALNDLSAEARVARQTALMRAQIALEDAMSAAARQTGRPTVLLCDRGVMDSAAYLSTEAWTAVLAEHGWNETLLRDVRYDAVLHLSSAADGAETAYSAASNPARTESVEEARYFDLRARDAWTGHPHLRLINNSATFAGKLARAADVVCRELGIPEPREIERKFLVRACPALDEMPVYSVDVVIEQVYLYTPDRGEARIRRRGPDGHAVYTHTVKQDVRPGERIEIERMITADEYAVLLDHADPTRRVIRKRRRTFCWAGHYFEMDIFVDPHAGLCLLEVELDNLDDPLELPPFLDIVGEVTADKAYSNGALARNPETPAMNGE